MSEQNELENKCKDHEFIGQCIVSLYKTNYDFYVNLESGYYEKVLCLNNDTIYTYDKKLGKLFQTDKEYNSEDDYLTIYITEINNGVPVLELDCTDIYLSYFERVLFRIKEFYYRYKFNSGL